MSKQRICKLCLAGLAAGLLSAATALPVHAQQGFGERLGEQLDQGINRLRSEVQEGWASLRQTVDKMGVQGRVYSRLRWDKQLADARIDVDAQEGGVVLLRGSAPTAEARKKAVQLANDTVGVTQVTDELTIAAPAEGDRRTDAPER